MNSSISTGANLTHSVCGGGVGGVGGVGVVVVVEVLIGCWWRKCWVGGGDNGGVAGLLLVVGLDWWWR